MSDMDDSERKALEKLANARLLRVKYLETENKRLKAWVMRETRKAPPPDYRKIQSAVAIKIVSYYRFHAASNAKIVHISKVAKDIVQAMRGKVQHNTVKRVIQKLANPKETELHDGNPPLHCIEPGYYGFRLPKTLQAES